MDLLWRIPFVVRLLKHPKFVISLPPLTQLIKPITNPIDSVTARTHTTHYTPALPLKHFRHALSIKALKPHRLGKPPLPTLPPVTENDPCTVLQGE